MTGSVSSLYGVNGDRQWIESANSKLTPTPCRAADSCCVARL
jgi:hypothetical protein